MRVVDRVKRASDMTDKSFCTTSNPNFHSNKNRVNEKNRNVTIRRFISAVRAVMI